MTTSVEERLYNLLPVVYRVRDADPEQRQALRVLLNVITQELRVLEDDVGRLYDNWFVETCDEWVVSYLGDLLGVRGLLPVQDGTFSQRGLVANTLGYRRRKGTAAVLEQLARDVTDWSTKVVEFFQLLATTEYLNHVRLDARSTVDLRNVDRLGLINTPFDRAAHTVDVRHIDNGRGKYNIPNIGLFLWRLQNYLIERSTPRAVVDPPDGRYSFTSLGYDAPLFTLPETEQEITQLAEEVNVRGPIRPAAFFFDLMRYQRTAVKDRPTESAYYGPDRSLRIIKDGATVSPMTVMCKDLTNWDRPPAAITGLLSGVLAPFPSLTSATPAVAVTIGGIGPQVATLLARPTTLNEAQPLLQAAIRAAGPGSGFAGTRVPVVGDQLLVLPGTPGASLTFAAAVGDPTSVDELGLSATAVQPVHGVLSGDLSPFPQLTFARPTMSLRIGGGTPRTVELDHIPGNLTEAQALLQDAIRAADPGPAFANAQVLAVENRLLVLPGTLTQAVAFSQTDADAASVYELALNHKVAVDVRLGRLAFAVGDEPRTSVSVAYNYGFSGDLGGGPYDRRRRGGASSGPGNADTVATPNALDTLIRVPFAGITTIMAALGQWNPATSPRAVIEITDSQTYREDLSIAMAGTELVIQAANNQRPTLIGNVTVTGGSAAARLEVNGLLVSGSLNVEGTLGSLKIVHSTLVPGRRLDIGGHPQEPSRPSIMVAAPNDRLTVDIERSIVGPLRLPSEITGLKVGDSILDAPFRGRPAHGVPAIVSSIVSSLTLSSPMPSINITIGEDGPHVATLSGVPTTIEEVSDQLEQAIRAAQSGTAFQQARVVAIPDVGGIRLIVVPGAALTVTIDPIGADPTAFELGLDRASVRHVSALIGGVLAPFPGLSAPAPSLNVTMGDEGPRTIQLPPAPPTIADVASALQNAIRNAAPDATSTFAAALVGTMDDRLVVLPGADGASALFDPAPPDTTTLDELALGSDRPAIAARDAGDRPGPPTTLERTTVFGAVHVKELTLASETIFTDLVTADRRQAGCVRFSHVPDGSRTPTRYRSQPDLAVQKALEAAKKADPSLGTAEEERIARDVHLRLTPTFTSVRYGDPAYAQLGAMCAEEIRTGAEDENEMGAFHFLRQAQRIKNLRTSLDEYLRFGLEAGIFFVT